MYKILILILAFFISVNVQANICKKLFETTSVKNAPKAISKKETPITKWTLEEGRFPDLKKVKPSDILTALDEAIQETREVVAQIKKVKNPTFENVVEALEFNDSKMKKFDGIFGFLYSGFKDEAFKAVEEEVLKRQDELGNEMWMDPVLFSKFDAVAKKRDSLPEDQRRLIDVYMEAFINNGLNLKGEQRERFIKNKQELVSLENAYLNNMIKSKSQFKLLVKTAEELKGLSPEVLSKLQALAKKDNQEGYLLTLAPAIYKEVMEKVENREIRRQIFIANGTIAYKSGETDNSPVVIRIAQLRQEQSELLGFKHYSDYALKNKMAKNVESVNKLTDQLIALYKPYALKEEQELVNFVKSKGVKEQLEPWDRSFWVEKLLQEKYVFNEDAIKEYLEYSKVQSALFILAEKLYGLTFKERKDLPKPDSEIQIFEVRNKDNELMAYFIMDPLAREEVKSTGAWASRIHPIYKQNGKRTPPIVTNSTNFTKPENGPFLLKVDEAVTMFHEFGHGLHSMLSQARYPSQSATAVARDFVELPSQFMENFFFEKEVLKMFAYNQKNELIPDHLVESIIKFKQFRAANATLRQLGLVRIDFAWHTGEALNMKGSLQEIEQKVLAPLQIYPDNSGTLMTTKFTHIFNGGYTSAYYSYKWAEVLDADAFSIFKKEGIFNPNTANRFLKSILETGGSRDAMEIYIEFAGREPNLEALLERDGITP